MTRQSGTEPAGVLQGLGWIKPFVVGASTTFTGTAIQQLRVHLLVGKSPGNPSENQRQRNHTGLPTRPCWMTMFLMLCTIPAVTLTATPPHLFGASGRFTPLVLEIHHACTQCGRIFAVRPTSNLQVCTTFSRIISSSGCRVILGRKTCDTWQG